MSVACLVCVLVMCQHGRTLFTTCPPSLTKMAICLLANARFTTWNATCLYVVVFFNCSNERFLSLACSLRIAMLAREVTVRRWSSDLWVGVMCSIFLRGIFESTALRRGRESGLRHASCLFPVRGVAPPRPPREEPGRHVTPFPPHTHSSPSLSAHPARARR